MSKLIQVRCPDCGATLVIDAATGAVLEHRPSERRKASLDLAHAAEQLKRESSERDAKFRDSMEAQKHREELLRRKFEEGLRKANRQGGPPAPTRDVDLD